MKERVYSNFYDEASGQVFPQVNFKIYKENFSDYDDANKCYGDTEIAEIEVTDNNGNRAVASLGIVGELNIKMNGIEYTNPDDFSPELVEAMNNQKEDYYDSPNIEIISDQSFGVFVDVFDKNNNKMAETEAYEWRYDLSDLTEKEIYEHLLSEAVDSLEREIGFDKDITKKKAEVER